MTPELRRQFDTEIADRTVVATQILFVLAVTLMPFFAVLDFILYPQAAWRLMTVRVVSEGVLLINLAMLVYLRRKGQARQYSRWLAYSIVYPTVAAMDLLMLRSGGAHSLYYAGLILVIIGVLVALPWSVYEMTPHTFFIWLQYPAVMLLFGPPLTSLGEFISNNFFLFSSALIGVAWGLVGHALRVKEFESRHALIHEKERSEQLLLSILPAEVAEELKAQGRVEAREVEDCSILFTDFVGFTSISSRLEAATLVRSLDRIFSGFDEIAVRHGLERLKTIGDAYMCAGGIPSKQPHHLVHCVLAGLEILSFLDDLTGSGGSGPEVAGVLWKVRIGIHRGPVTAGVIGRTKFAYDIWGDTVNTASRLESTSEVGRINLATGVLSPLLPLFEVADRGEVVVKGKGPMRMSFVTGIRPEYAADRAQRLPNDSFWARYHELSAAAPPAVAASGNKSQEPQKGNHGTQPLDQ